MVNKKGSLQAKSIKIVYSTDNLSNPLYSNNVLIRFSQHEYTFEFYFVDQAVAEKNIREGKNEVTPNPVARISMTHEMAENFLNAFKKNHTLFKKSIIAQKDKK